MTSGTFGRITERNVIRIDINDLECVYRKFILTWTFREKNALHTNNIGVPTQIPEWVPRSADCDAFAQINVEYPIVNLHYLVSFKDDDCRSATHIVFFIRSVFFFFFNTDAPQMIVTVRKITVRFPSFRFRGNPKTEKLNIGTQHNFVGIKSPCAFRSQCSSNANHVVKRRPRQ